MANDRYESYVGVTGFPSADCTPTVLPAPVFSDCPEAYVAHEGEIVEVYLSNVVFNTGTGKWDAVSKPTDWTDAAGYAVTGLRRLIGFGDKPLASIVTVPIPRNLTKTLNRKHILNFDFTDMSAANYELVRALQASEWVAMWYWSIDLNAFGGADGVICHISNAGNVHARGENALLTGQIVFDWENLVDPPMSPLSAPAPLTAGIQAPAPLKSKSHKQEAEV